MNTLASKEYNNLRPAGKVLNEIESGNPPELHSETSNIRRHDEPDAAVCENEGDEKNKLQEATTILRSYEYRMSYKERGCFIIFSQTVFSNKLETREIAKDDYIKMEQIAIKLGFEYIKTCHEYTRHQILELIETISNSSHIDYDCFGLAMLSHGGQSENGENFIYAKDDSLYIDELTQPFSASNCPSLALKPKLFFIQACRGGKKDKPAPIPFNFRSTSSIQSDALPSTEDISDENALTSILIPSQADFLIAYSCSPGFTSWKTKGTGTWFVDALHKCVIEYEEDDIEMMRLMTRVINTVSSYVTMDWRHMQVPCIMSQLCSLLYFRPKSNQITDGH